MPRPSRVRGTRSKRIPSVFVLDGFLIEAYNHVDDLPRLSQTPRKRPRHATRGAAAAERRADLATAPDPSTQNAKPVVTRNTRQSAARSTSPASSTAAEETPCTSLVSNDATCRVCLRGSSPLKIIRCVVCRKSVHSFCLNPPIMTLPTTSTWTCQLCMRDPISFKKETRLILRSALSDFPHLCTKKYITSIADAVRVVSSSMLSHPEKNEREQQEGRNGALSGGDMRKTDNTVVLKITEADSDFEDIDDDETVLESTHTPGISRVEETPTKGGTKAPANSKMNGQLEAGCSSTPEPSMELRSQKNLGKQSLSPPVSGEALGEASADLEPNRDVGRASSNAAPGSSGKAVISAPAVTPNGAEGRQYKEGGDSAGRKSINISEDDRVDISIAEEFVESIDRGKARRALAKKGTKQGDGHAGLDDVQTAHKKTFSLVTEHVMTAAENVAATQKRCPAENDGDSTIQGSSCALELSRKDDCSAAGDAGINVAKPAVTTHIGGSLHAGQSVPDAGEYGEGADVSGAMPVLCDDEDIGIVEGETGKETLRTSDQDAPLSEEATAKNPLSNPTTQGYPVSEVAQAATPQTANLSVSEMDLQDGRAVSGRCAVPTAVPPGSNVRSTPEHNLKETSAANAATLPKSQRVSRSTPEQRISQTWGDMHLDAKREALLTFAMGQKGSRPRRTDGAGRAGSSLDHDTIARTTKGHRIDNVPESERKRMQAIAALSRGPQVANQSLMQRRMNASAKASINSLLQHNNSSSSQDGSDLKRRRPNPPDQGFETIEQRMGSSATYVTASRLPSLVALQSSSESATKPPAELKSTSGRLPALPSVSGDAWGGSHMPALVSPVVSGSYIGQQTSIRNNSDVPTPRPSQVPLLSMKRQRKRPTMVPAPESIPRHLSSSPGFRSQQGIQQSDPLTYRGRGDVLSSQFSHAGVVANVENSDRMREQWSKKFDAAHSSFARPPTFSSEYGSEVNRGQSGGASGIMFSAVGSVDTPRNQSPANSLSHLPQREVLRHHQAEVSNPHEKYRDTHLGADLYQDDSVAYRNTEARIRFRTDERNAFLPSSGQRRRELTGRDGCFDRIGSVHVQRRTELRYEEQPYDELESATARHESSMYRKAMPRNNYMGYDSSMSLEQTHLGQPQVMRKPRKSRSLVPQSGSAVRRTLYEQGRALMTVGGGSGSGYGQGSTEEHRHGSQQQHFDQGHAGSVYRRNANDDGRQSSADFMDSRSLPNAHSSMCGEPQTLSRPEIGVNSHSLPSYAGVYSAPGGVAQQAACLPHMTDGSRQLSIQRPAMTATFMPERGSQARTVYHFTSNGDSEIQQIGRDVTQVGAGFSHPSVGSSLRQSSRSYTPIHMVRTEEAMRHTGEGQSVGESLEVNTRSPNTPPVRTVPSLRNLLS